MSEYAMGILLSYYCKFSESFMYCVMAAKYDFFPPFRVNCFTPMSGIKVSCHEKDILLFSCMMDNVYHGHDKLFPHKRFCHGLLVAVMGFRLQTKTTIIHWVYLPPLRGEA